jgi:hypothetical protein
LKCPEKVLDRDHSASIKKTFDDNWDKIFKKQDDNTGTDKNEYQDVIATEDCIDVDDQQGY